MPAIIDNYTWWGEGKNPEFIYETTYNCKLNDTNYSSKTPSTTAQALYWPATTYTTSGTGLQYPTFDRYGTGYHNGEPLDFSKYDYFVLEDYIADIKYTVDEAAMGALHSIKATQSGFSHLYESFKTTSGNIIIPTDTIIGTATMATQNFYGIWYRNASNVLNFARQGYGIYFTQVGPSFSSTSYLAVPYINFRLPYVYIRGHNSYHPVSSFTNIDTENTQIKVRMRLYKIDKSSTYRLAGERQVYMYQNNAFPTEVI